MVVGAIFSLLAATAFSAGNLMEKVAVGRMPAFSTSRVAHMVRQLASSRLWVLGFFISLVGLGIQVLAFSRIPILAVQGIFGGAIVLLVLAARRYLGEPLRRSEIVGIAISVPSIVLVGVSLAHSKGSAGASASIPLVLLASALTLGVAAAFYFGLSRRYRTVGLLYGITSGIVYGVASLASKGASIYVIKDGIASSVPSIFSSPYPYLFVVASGMGLLIYQSGLQRCRISVVAPVSAVLSSIYIAAVGTVLFGERLPSDRVDVVLRLVGFAGVVVGTFLLGGSEPTFPDTSAPIVASADRSEENSLPNR